MQHTNTWNMVKSWIVYALVFLFPLFFLPVTQEFYTTNKLYLLAFGGIILLIISVVEFAMNKKITWSRKPFDTNVLLIVAAVGLTTVITTPNKVGSLVNPYLGLIAILALGIFYMFLTHAHRSRREVAHEMELGKLNYFTVLTVSSVVLSLLAIISFFNPFRSISLPGIFGFLSNPTFTPMGMPLDLGIFLGFMAIAHIVYIITRNETAEQRNFTQSMWLSVGSVCVILIALIFTLFTILKPGSTANPVNLLPPFRISWYAAVEILKNPLTALFGGGIGNFSSIFASVKDAAYNTSPLWQIQSFNASRSTILHIFTETGLFGLVAFGLLIMQAVRLLKGVKNSLYKVLFAYIMLVLFLLPPSLPVMFLLVVLLAVMPQDAAPVVAPEGSPAAVHGTTINMAHIIPLYAGILVLAVALIGGATYFLGRSYASEYYFKQALDGIGSNNAQQLYTSQRQAILMNPYIERFRISFSQTNLLLANNFAIAATAPEQEGGKPRQLSESDRNNIAQAIQAAIQEAKAAVTLNPQNPGNWENLANIYRNVLNVAQGADAWTVASYQEAMGRDPRNPSLFLNLGGVFYSIGNYDDAIRMFEQAVVLKPDWSNAYYNLAWSAAQKGDFARAAGTMEQVIRLIDPSAEEADYKKAMADLQDFRSKVPPAQKPQQGQEESAAGQQPQELALPTSPVATVEPKLDLPQNAEPPTNTTGREATGSAVQGDSTRISPTPSVATDSAGGP